MSYVLLIQFGDYDLFLHEGKIIQRFHTEIPQTDKEFNFTFEERNELMHYLKVHRKANFDGDLTVKTFIEKNFLNE